MHHLLSATSSTHPVPRPPPSQDCLSLWYSLHLALLVYSLTPGVAPLRTFCHRRVYIFGLFPWARPQFRIWLTVGYTAIAIAIAWHSHTGGGAWPGPLIVFAFFMLAVIDLLTSPGQAPPPVCLCHAMAIAIAA